MTDCILVLDFGGQYCHLIARRIRELSVYSEIVSPGITLDEINGYEKRYDVKGLIISGGPQSVYGENAPEFNVNLLDLDLGILGLCYGHQLIAHHVGGGVEPGQRKEYGITEAHIDKAVGILKDLERKEKVWMSHSDTVLKIPDDYEVLAHTDNSPVAAFRHKKKMIYGLQWHPEVVHTVNGRKMFRNLVYDVCGCEGNWVMEDFVEESVEKIREDIGNKKALIALSGGVDSSTAAVLTHKALGENLTAVFVDTGLMREN
ncbi:MAG: glutamine-hydrolyzing GMP synthase, partial [Candidatus Altiarchaeales archaeon]|nr:glutamine-hydrolyzing GMP synthase [Candidatus Altiarchaeales archaeon]